MNVYSEYWHWRASRSIRGSNSHLPMVFTDPSGGRLVKIYVYVPLDPSRRRSMMTIVPSMGMVVIMIIIMGLVAARQGEADDEEKEPDADEILYAVFHVR
jgi:hypothetical protein